MEGKLERAVVFLAKIEADDEDSLVKALHDMATAIAINGLSERSISGGVSWSHIYTSRKNDIDHDEYFRLINEELL